MSKLRLSRCMGSLFLFGIAACSGAQGPSDTDASFETLSSGASLSLSCSGCHSEISGAIASLADYPEDLLQETLLAYKLETDGTTVMHRLARGYSEEEIALISAALGAETGAP